MPSEASSTATAETVVGTPATDALPHTDVWGVKYLFAAASEKFAAFFTGELQEGSLRDGIVTVILDGVDLDAVRDLKSFAHAA